MLWIPGLAGRVARGAQCATRIALESVQVSVLPLGSMFSVRAVGSLSPFTHLENTQTHL